MVTVLLATYQGEAFLRQQLDSIMNQTLEVKIVASDDGSEDHTRDILEDYKARYPQRIVLCNKEKTQKTRSAGLHPAAANFFWLLSLVSGDSMSEDCVRKEQQYYMLSDQDDVWEPYKAETLFKRMKKLEKRWGETRPLLVHSDLSVVDENLNLIHPSFFQYQRCDPHRSSFGKILVENPVTGGAIMMNRALAELLKEEPGFCCMHDWWIALTASCFGTISCVEKSLYRYRQHSGNTLGARQTGSVEDIRRRLGNTVGVEENYRRMFAQAEAFGQNFGLRMTYAQRQTLQAFLELPAQNPLGRLFTILRYGFFKSSWLLTAAQCMTIPKKIRKPENNTDSGSAAEGKITNCVIVNYNDAGTAARLVRRIHDYACLQQILIVDNASSDDSLKRLELLQDEKVTVLRSEKNGGYGAGNNLGVRYAVRENQADYVLIANPDVSFSEGCVRAMVHVLQRYQDAGVAAAVMTGSGHRRNGWRLHGFVGELLTMGPVSRRLFGFVLNYPEACFKGKKAVNVEAVHGSLLMVKTEAFKKCGGYDEGIFLYQEEAVLGQRMRTAGYRTILLLNQTFHHEHAVSIGKAHEKLAERQKLRNESVMYYMKHYLHIRPWQELVAKLWFQGILLEDRAAEWLDRVLKNGERK